MFLIAVNYHLTLTLRINLIKMYFLAILSRSSRNFSALRGR